ncbi:MAG: hypothetical protein WC437_00645 [Patescibacteria group bacterium]|jgi:hypothetical protein|nr:hypothetical protein [Patescibacteria group bacterium]
MQDDKWGDLIDDLETKFGELNRKIQTSISEDDTGHEVKTTEEWVEFETPMGRMKLSRITRPMIIDKKFHYTHSAGGRGKVEYVMSDTEKTHKTKLYKWDDLKDDWQEVQTTNGELRF